MEDDTIVSAAFNSSKRPYSQHFDADVHMFGDKTTLMQVVLLLAYIRNHIQTKTPGDIKVSIGKHLETEAFTFSVNGHEVPQVIASPEIEIN